MDVCIRCAVVWSDVASSLWLKPGFHYQSWRPELTGVKNAPELTGRELGPWTRVVETGLKPERVQWFVLENTEWVSESSWTSHSTHNRWLWDECFHAAVDCRGILKTKLRQPKNTQIHTHTNKNQFNASTLTLLKKTAKNLNPNKQAIFHVLKTAHMTDCVYRVGQKTGPPYLIANILKIPWPNCVEIGELLQCYMLNTVINFLFKNFVALWRHLAKTQLLCDVQIYNMYNVNKRQ